MRNTINHINDTRLKNKLTNNYSVYDEKQRKNDKTKRVFFRVKRGQSKTIMMQKNA